MKICDKYVRLFASVALAMVCGLMASAESHYMKYVQWADEAVAKMVEMGEKGNTTMP